MPLTVTKPLDLALLEQELAAASVPANGLGVSGRPPLEPGDKQLYTYDAAGEIADLPPSAVPVVDAHTAPPAVVDYAEQDDIAALARTTDATPSEMFRFACLPKHIYRTNLRLSAVDAGNGACRIIEARFVWKRPAATPIIVGSTVVSSIADAGAASWTQSIAVSGTDIVFTVTGAAGRTIDWLLAGEVGAFAPEGLAP